MPTKKKAPQDSKGHRLTLPARGISAFVGRVTKYVEGNREEFIVYQATVN